jgi:tRNA1(Val) A37 N6-methylase TrmN6
LARRTFELEMPFAAEQSVLDLCAGCGVVGLDFLFHLEQAKAQLPDRIDFLEVQNIYQSHFIKNISEFETLKRYQFLLMNYADVFKNSSFQNKYDLILCNPPYFFPDRGVLSDSNFKNRCRFFLDADFEKLIQAIEYLLKPHGKAYVLLKDLPQNGLSMRTELQKISHHLEINQIEKIRNTDLYLIRRRPDLY